MSIDNKNNSGYYNSGNWNSGNYNSDHYNSGDYNSGDWNSGHRNSGNWNSGNWNSGDYNSGYYNSGNWNSGHRNSGDCNSGDCNSGDHNSGLFNTNEPKIRLFNRETDMTVSEFYEKYDLDISLPLNRWIRAEDMSDKEKEQVIGWKEMGGYLKTLDYKEAWKVWWEENPEGHEKFTKLPNFSASIFKEITGIDVEKPEEIVEIDGKKYSKSTIKEALKEHFN
jgi:hypothetical protein